MSAPFSTISFIFEAILLAALLAAVLAWLSIRLAWRVGLLDLPDSAPHKKHTQATPLAGGIALIATLLISALAASTFTDPSVRAALLAGLIVFFFGLWDDYKGISPLLKFAGQTAAVILLVLMGVRIRVFESPEFFFGGQSPLYVSLDILLTWLWMVGITNAFNFVDSTDGLAVGLTGVAAAFFMLVTLESGQLLLSYQNALILGACIGLFFFNSPPAMLFLGDSGAQSMGFILAALAIAYQPQGANQSSSWVVPVLLLAVPIFDMALVVFSRLRRRRPIYAAARDHTYHRLLALGLNTNRAGVFMQTLSLLLGCLAFILLTQSPLVANTAFAGVLIVGLLAMLYLDNRKRWP
jgi:UDP-GlcNAc:undecaprenyl-phosphate GlcNAc-1-phosphate transferase